MPQKKTICALVILGLAASASLPAIAQETITAPQPQTDTRPDSIDRVTGVATPGAAVGRAPEGVRVAAPGALVFASFDRNSNGRVSLAEIEAGAGAVFVAADRNGDGKITGFEQSDWAASIGSPTDVMANTMTFDIDLDRAVTQAEFVAGLKRIAGQIQPTGELTFADLLRPLNRGAQEGEPPPSAGWSVAPRAGGNRGGH